MIHSRCSTGEAGAAPHCPPVWRGGSSTILLVHRTGTLAEHFRRAPLTREAKRGWQRRNAHRKSCQFGPVSWKGVDESDETGTLPHKMPIVVVTSGGDRPTHGQTMLRDSGSADVDAHLYTAGQHASPASAR